MGYELTKFGVYAGTRAICYFGSKNGTTVAGTAQILSDKGELARVYRAYWRTHPAFMLLGIGLRIWIEMLLAIG